MNLLDICKIGGSSVKKFDGTRKYIATGDIIDNEITSYEFVNYNSKPSRANVEIKNNDVLFAKMKDTVKVLKANDNNINNIYSTGFYCMTPNDDVLQEYLYYYFKSESFNSQKNKNCSGATQKAINNDGLKKIKIKFLPDVEEQNKIVKELSYLERLTTIKNEEVNKLNLLVKSQFVEMFGEATKNEKSFPVINIGDKCFVTKLAGFEYSKYIDYKDSGDVIMVRGLNVKNQRLKLDDVYYIDQSISDSLPRSQLKNGDVCMTYVGINIGDVALVDNYYKYHLAPNVAKISINNIEEINPQFFVYLLAYNKSNFASNATNTAKQALNMDRIRKLSIMLPPIELQNKFAQIVEQIDKQKFEFEKSLKKLEELQASLMQEYFG